MQSQQVEVIISYQHKHNNPQHPTIKSILGIRIPYSFIILILQIITEYKIETDSDMDTTETPGPSSGISEAKKSKLSMKLTLAMIDRILAGDSDTDTETDSTVTIPVPPISKPIDIPKGTPNEYPNSIWEQDIKSDYFPSP
jgi:hypothetical protein